MSTATEKREVSQVDFQRFVKSAHLADIALRSIEANCLFNPFTIDPTKVTISIDTQVSYDKSDEDLHCFVVYGISGVEQDAKKFYVNVCYCAMYTIEKLESYSDDVIQLFATNNGLFNTYSFARESIHSAMQKMLLPPFVLPLLKPDIVKLVDESRKS